MVKTTDGSDGSDGSNATLSISEFEFSEDTSILSTTASSSATTGALTVAGGVGIADDLYVGDALYLPTTGGTAGGLDYYETYASGSKEIFRVETADSLCTAPIYTSCNAVRTGDIVTLQWTNSASNPSAFTDYAWVHFDLPSTMQPSGASLSSPLIVTKGSANQLGRMLINAAGGTGKFLAGSARISTDLTTSGKFVASGNAAIVGGSISYSIL